MHQSPDAAPLYPRDMCSHEEQHSAGIPGTAGRERLRGTGLSLLCDGSPGRVTAHRQLPPGAMQPLGPCSGSVARPRGSARCICLQRSLAGAWPAISTQRGGACLIPGNMANFQILPCRVARGIITNRGWGKPGFLALSPGEWPGPRQCSPRAACISIDNEPPHLEMLLTHPLHKCLPGGGDAPSIPKLEEGSLSSTTRQGRAPSKNGIHWPEPPATPGHSRPLQAWSLGTLCLGWVMEQGLCCYDGGHSARERGLGNQGETDPPFSPDPETPSLKQQSKIHSLRTWRPWFEV